MFRVTLQLPEDAPLTELPVNVIQLTSVKDGIVQCHVLCKDPKELDRVVERFSGTLVRVSGE